MQTFLPYADYIKCAEVLDRQRLGKQRVEVKQILRTLAGITNGWKNHPAVKMWQDHDFQLASYGFLICKEWIDRGYEDNIQPDIALLGCELKDGTDRPSWLGDQEFHRRHRSNLLEKDPEHYGQYGWSVEPGLDYYWPE